jgi:hypothetical protein
VLQNEPAAAQRRQHALLLHRVSRVSGEQTVDELVLLAQRHALVPSDIAHHNIGCCSTQETRVRNALNDVARDIIIDLIL